MQSQTIDNTKFFRLNFQESLERFFFRRSICEPYKIFNIKDAFERSVIEQIQYNDSKSLVCKVVTGKEMADVGILSDAGSADIVYLWHIDDWRTHYANVQAKKKAEIQARRYGNALNERINALLVKVRKVMPVDEKTAKSILRSIIEAKHLPSVQPLLKIYNLTVEELEIMVEDLNENKFIDEQKAIDARIANEVRIKLETLKTALTHLVVTQAYTQAALTDYIRLNGYGVLAEHTEVIAIVKQAKQ